MKTKAQHTPGTFGKKHARPANWPPSLHPVKKKQTLAETAAERDRLKEDNDYHKSLVGEYSKRIDRLKEAAIYFDYTCGEVPDHLEPGQTFDITVTVQGIRDLKAALSGDTTPAQTSKAEVETLKKTLGEVTEMYRNHLPTSLDDEDTELFSRIDKLLTPSLVPAQTINGELLEALKYYKDGIDHFYKCMNFAKSNMDATAITFMNESNIKISKAIAKAEGRETHEQYLSGNRNGPGRSI